MKFKFRLFLWLSSMLAAIGFYMVAKALPESGHQYAKALPQLSNDPQEMEAILKTWPMALKSLAVLIGIGSTLLFLVGKNFRAGLYLGIFAGLMILSILIASAISTY